MQKKGHVCFYSLDKYIKKQLKTHQTHQNKKAVFFIFYHLLFR
jgi:hypothetical protein